MGTALAVVLLVLMVVLNCLPQETTVIRPLDPRPYKPGQRKWKKKVTYRSYRL